MAQEPRSLFPAIIFLCPVEGIYEEKFFRDALNLGMSFESCLRVNGR
jgi:hypothetical protein